MIPFRCSAVTGSHETEIFVEDMTSIMTVCGGPPGAIEKTRNDAKYLTGYGKYCTLCLVLFSQDYLSY